MIHQFIFAGPKPGLSSEAFLSYWINFHAVEYAAKIPQIKQYLIAGRAPSRGERELPFYQGVAEIWLNDEVDQIASLQSREFLEGARRDEPRWAAFWQTLVLDTDPTVLREYSGPEPWPEFTKLYVLLKRRPGFDLGEFRERLLSRTVAVPELQRHLVALARSTLYGLGEPRFDAIEVLSFSDREAAAALLTDGYTQSVAAATEADSRYFFTFIGRETWIIRPSGK